MAFRPEHRLAIGLVALGVTAFAVLLSLSRGGTMSLAAVGLVTTGMLLKTGRITPKVAGGFLGVVSADWNGPDHSWNGSRQYPTGFHLD